MEETQEKSQKTVVAFIAGLLIGGALVWIFIGADEKPSVTPTEDQTQEEVKADEEKNGEETNTTATTPSLSATPAVTAQPVVVAPGSGSVSVADQKAGAVVVLGEVTFPADAGWVVVHELNENGSLANILGAARFGVTEGLTPKQVELLRATKAGAKYHVVLYSENGDKVFEKGEDVAFTTADGARIEGAFAATE